MSNTMISRLAKSSLSTGMATLFIVALHNHIYDDTTLSYSEFVNASENGAFQEITIGPKTISGMTTQGNIHSTRIPPGAEPYKDVRNPNSKIKAQKEISTIWAALYIVLSCVGGLLALGGIFPSLRHEFIKAIEETAPNSKFFKKRIEDNGNEVTFNDIKGVDEAKAELLELLDYLKNPAEYHAKGIKVAKGMLLVGSPGGGKTMLAKALANEAGVPFHYLSGASIDGKLVGSGSGKIETLFAEARKNRPCIVFIDEIDAVAGRRRANSDGQRSRWENQTINQLLTELDGFENSEGIVVIGATNLPDTLDPALLRPGRLTTRVDVPLPDVNGRLAIIESYAKKIKIEEGLKLIDVAKSCPGMAGAELKEVVNLAALIAHRDKRSATTMNDFRSARDRLIMGLERKSQYIPEETKRLVAWHELGHAFVNYDLGQEVLDKISIIPRGKSLGQTISLPPNETGLHTKRQLKGKLTALFGGRAAEKIYCEKEEDYTSGAHGDIQEATKIARMMVEELGMSDDDKLGSVRYAGRDDISEDTRRKIDNAIRKLLSEAEKEASDIIKKYQKQGAFDKATNLLLDEETISGEQLASIISQPTPP